MMHPNVIVVDDEPQMVEILSGMVSLLGLKGEGYTCAETFLENIHSVDDRTVVTLDLQMPGVDGVEVMRRLARLPDPPALILISGGDTGVLHAAEKLGHAQNLRILASMGKPIHFSQFSAVLHRQIADAKTIAGSPHPVTGLVSAVDLSRAIATDELDLHFQPQIRLVDMALVGFEALLRWQHPESGLIYPDTFIPLAEESGLIDELSEWVIRNAARHWRESIPRGCEAGIAVNISPTNITSLTLPEQLTDMLRSYGMGTTSLTLEITENALMTELVTSLDILTRMRLKGIRLSVDDFGTGYSSLKLLHRIPFSELKIDRAFVSNMREDSEALSIVKICIMLGHELGMQVIAEGVEDQLTLDLLTEMGCELAQGFHIARPIPSAQLFAWIQNWNAEADASQSATSR